MDTMAYEEFADEYYNIGDYEKARQMLEIARNLNPKDPDLMWKLGMAYLHLEKERKGVELIERAVEMFFEESGIEARITDWEGFIGGFELKKQQNL